MEKNKSVGGIWVESRGKWGGGGNATGTGIGSKAELYLFLAFLFLCCCVPTINFAEGRSSPFVGKGDTSMRGRQARVKTEKLLPYGLLCGGREFVQDKDILASPLCGNPESAVTSYMFLRTLSCTKFKLHVLVVCGNLGASVFVLLAASTRRCL